MRTGLELKLRLRLGFDSPETLKSGSKDIELLLNGVAEKRRSGGLRNSFRSICTVRRLSFFIDHGEGAQEYSAYASVVCVLVLFMFNDTKIFIHFILAVHLHPSRLHSLS